MPIKPVDIVLSNGVEVILRPAGPEDEPRFEHIVANMSEESRYLRFFSGVKVIPKPIIHALADADGHRHIAWAAALKNEPGQPFIAAAHAIIDRVEADLLEQFPGTELLIHIDPEGHVDEPDNPLVEDNEFAKLEKDA